VSAAGGAGTAGVRASLRLLARTYPGHLCRHCQDFEHRASCSRSMGEGSSCRCYLPAAILRILAAILRILAAIPCIPHHVTIMLQDACRRADQSPHHLAAALAAPTISSHPENTQARRTIKGARNRVLARLGRADRTRESERHQYNIAGNRQRASSLLDVPQRAAYSGNHWAAKESAARGLATTGTGLNDN
jgi:hypothetical protein